MWKQNRYGIIRFGQSLITLARVMIMFTSIVLSITPEFVKTLPEFVRFSLTNAIKKPLEISRGFFV